MMIILCVDSDIQALKHTVSLCREMPGCSETAGFTRAEEAAKWLKENTADVAVLETVTADMDGMTLAARIRKRYPDTRIIFATGDARYAVDAFALHVSGYLMKPVSAERLHAEIAYALSVRHSGNTAHISVQTFGNFDISVNGKPVIFARSKAKELLAYLVDRQGSSVARAEVFTVLWEEGVYDRPRQKQLDVIIRSLRTTLQEHGIGEILDIRSGFLRICPDTFDCDLYRFFEGDTAAVNAYRGEYMSSYSWASLTEAYMDRIRRKRDE